MTMPRDLAQWLFEEHSRVDAVVFRQLVTSQDDVVGAYNPGGVKKRKSFQATAFQSLDVICRTLDGGI
jgi:hypothetical protein